MIRPMNCSSIVLLLVSLPICSGFLPAAPAVKFSALFSSVENRWSDCTVEELKTAIRELNPPKGTLSKLKRKQEMIDYLENTSQSDLPEVDSLEEDSEEYSESDGSFADFELSSKVMAALSTQPHWKVPTPIQSLAIPYFLDKEQSPAIWAEAPTGSGKTAAYLLPLIHRVLENPQQGVDGLILSPTRELTVQIGSVLSELCASIGGLKVTTVYGGVSVEDQIQSLTEPSRKAHVVVATPGRLVDVLTLYQSRNDAKEAELEQRILKAMGGRSDATLNLDQIQDLEEQSARAAPLRSSLQDLLQNMQLLVLDEADRLLGRAFEKEMRLLLDLFPAVTPPVWMVSATFPRSIEPRVYPFLKQLHASGEVPTLQKLSCSNSDRSTELEPLSSSVRKKMTRIESTEKVQRIGPASTIRLRTIRLDKPLRTPALRHLLEQHKDWDKVLVFVATRYAAEHVSRKLRRNGIQALEWHGKLDQDARLRRVEDLKNGKIRVLVATDVASRGIDITNLPVVINYDLPRSTVDFVHRIGRVGRSGQEGTAISFCTATSESHLDLIEKRHLVDPVEREVLPKFAPDEDKWLIEASASLIQAGQGTSEQGLAHDRMFGGVKGSRKSKKDRKREEAARKSLGRP